MGKYLDADILEKDGWNMQRVRQVSLTEMVCETKKPTDFPTADVVEVKHGRWIDKYNDGDRHCSECGAIVEKDEQNRHNWYRCYHCGAKMDKECENESY